MRLTKDERESMTQEERDEERKGGDKKRVEMA